MAVGLTEPKGGAGGRKSLAELLRLIDSAEAEVVGSLDFALRRIEPRYFVGRDRARQLGAMASELGADGIVFDCALSPAQLNNLAELCGCKVTDRQAVILDIFARRARTREAKLQVELAQLRYLLPRLRGYGVALSRLGGGIGTRGPGETMLETDRRVMGERIRRLEDSLKKVRKRHNTQRQARARQGMPLVALIGYTNAGKSTLLNELTGADSYVADRLFATLTPQTRRLALPGGGAVVASDTVGLIHNLPTLLVAAFRATLEEMQYAELLVHLLDASSPDMEREYAATQQLLGELNLLELPRLVVYNKLDLIDRSAPYQVPLPDKLPSLAVSVETGEGLPELLVKVENMIMAAYPTIEVLLPFAQASLLSELQDEAQVLELEHLAEGARLKLRCTARRAGQLQPYLFQGNGE